MKAIVVVGARPNFMKAAPILRAIRTNPDASTAITSVLVHTGQHYDATMSATFFRDLNLPEPDIHLGAGSASHASQTAEIMQKFETVLENERPDVVIVVGDVNSTLACALVTAKISAGPDSRRPLLAHVEAGLRSFDRDMPEECNRIVTDHLSDLLFVTEESGLRNLQNEGISSARVFFVGNTMIDSLLACEQQAEHSLILRRLGLAVPEDSCLSKPYVLLTLHRPANVDDRSAFLEILEGLQEIEEDIIFPAHPRTQKKIREHELESYFLESNFDDQMKPEPTNRNHPAAIKRIDPLGYLDFLCLMKHASLVVTDSGGIQEETTCLGVPCVTVRESTERPITLSRGTNLLGGTRRNRIRHAVRHQRQRSFIQSTPELWEGRASERIVEILLQQLRLRDSTSSIEQAPSAHANL
jgi:UDP-N-acetylglucosamine 2-epimerase (non-hydrolysing)